MRNRWLLLLFFVVMILGGCPYTVPIPPDVTFNNNTSRWSWTGTWLSETDQFSLSIVQDGDNLSGAGDTSLIGKVDGNIGRGTIKASRAKHPSPFTLVMSDDGMYLKGDIIFRWGWDPTVVRNLKRAGSVRALATDDAQPAAASVQTPATTAKIPARPSAASAAQPSPSPARAPTAAVASPRRALVIGNAAYPASPLRNSLHDASDMAGVLQRLGFSVTVLRDADQRTMAEAIEVFTSTAPRGSVGLFYFSGHGVQIEGQNYLLPVGGGFREPADVKYRAVLVPWVLERMENAGMEAKLLILDACRNNPFGRSWTRSLTQGLASMDTVTGAMIAYGTSPGKVALEGTGRNSPYTKWLLQQMPTPGQSVEQMFKAVRVAVQQETRGEQTPWEASSLVGDLYFGGR